MITNYSIENFKVFLTEANLKFAPITLIYGPNSSGKSSIIQSLIVLRESLIKNNQSNSLKTNNSFFELGSYVSVVNNHDSNKKIKYQIEFSNISYLFEYAFKSNGQQNISYLDNISVKDRENLIKDFKFTRKDRVNSEVNVFKINYNFDLLQHYEEKNKYIKDLVKHLSKNELYEKMDFRKIYQYSLDQFAIRKGFVLPNYSTSNQMSLLESDNIKERVEGIYVQHYMDALTSDIQKLDKNLYNQLFKISYIGPLRPHPKRVYQLDNVVTNSVGQNGENFLSFLARDDKYIKEVNRIFEEFGIKYDIEIFRTNNEVIGDTVSIYLVDRHTGLKTTLVDVGFGIGQVLPIILEGLVKNRGTICIEQPEIHLHPKLQANLANFFAKDIKSKYPNQWIIETHSEALLLRFQRLIKHKELEPNDISIIYVNPTETGAEVIPIPLDEDGDFTITWPNGFFEERLDEMFGGNPFGDE